VLVVPVVEVVGLVVLLPEVLWPMPVLPLGLVVLGVVVLGVAVPLGVVCVVLDPMPVDVPLGDVVLGVVVVVWLPVELPVAPVVPVLPPPVT
jgi:hypothetical protein